MSRHIAEVIRLRKDNEYREDREEDDIRSYDLIERANAYIRNYINNVLVNQ